MLFKAKTIFERTSVELVAHMKFLLKADIFTDKQILNGHVREEFFKPTNCFDDIWKVDIKPVKYEIDLHKDPITGKKARKVIPEEERVFSFEYNKFSLPEESNVTV